MQVRPSRAAIVAGLLVAVVVAALYTVRVVPDSIVGLLGGPTGFARIGGLRVVYRPAPGTEAAVERFAAANANVRREGGAFVLEYPGILDEAAREVVEILEHGGIEFREVIAGTNYAAEIGESDEVKLDTDAWRAEDGGSPPKIDMYLWARSTAALDAAIDAAVARGWRAPAGTQIVYEWVEAQPDARDPRAFWRTYLVSSTVAMDGTTLAKALGSYDPNMGRPLVLLDFTREGAERFCELTGRIAGGKLATVVGGRVRSAPIINGQICGGRASITMGGSDPRRQEQERDALVAILGQPTPPPGGTVLDRMVIEPAEIATLEWLGRLLLGVLCGVLFGAVTYAAVRFARPVQAASAPRLEGAFPWRRVLVTALAPLALIGGAYVPIPGVDPYELDVILRGAAGDTGSLVALGIGPVITAFVFVEIAALAITRLRALRHDPVGRAKLGKAVVVVAIVFALVQSYFIAANFEQVGALDAGLFGMFGDPAPSHLVPDPGWKFRIVLALSLSTATLLLAVLAGMIREHGLGNGYAALLASSILIDVLRPLYDVGLDYYAHPGAKLGLVTAAAIAIATVFALRWRVSILRVPTSGISPLSDSASLVYLVLTLGAIAVGPSLHEALVLFQGLTATTLLGLAILVGSIPVWGWLFARPSLVEESAIRAGLPAPTLGAWARATLLSILFVGGTAAAGTLAMLTDASAATFAMPINVILVTAAIMDIVADARARCAALVPAAVVHQVQHLGVVEHLLTAANIPYHLHASHVRTLYAFFGPWAPVVVLVPAEHGETARQKLDTRLSAFD